MSAFNRDNLFRIFATRSLIQALLLLLSCLCLAAPALAGTEVGAIPGSFGVSATGAAGYSIPIGVPPGRNGLTPHLALVYSSQSGNGMAGYGWTVSGLSSITVCGSTFAQDGVNQGVIFSSQTPYPNNFCLDGTRLLLTGGTNGVSGSQYRKEVDDISYATAYTSGGAGAVPTLGPQYFIVQMPNGLIYEYGKTADSEILANLSGITEARAWALDAIYDSYGNSINFTYGQDTAYGDFWPKTITYTNNNGSGGAHTIVFSYDVLSSINAGLMRGGFLAGADINETRRLNEIDVDYNGATTFAYKLTYNITVADSDGNPGTERSLLNAVTECAGATCYPATTINWQQDHSGWSSSGAQKVPGTDGSLTSAQASSAHLMDVNGDGIADLVYPGSTDWMVILGTKNGLGAPVNSTIPVDDYQDALAIDFYGDGRTELLEPSKTGGTGNWVLVTFDGSGHGSSTQALGPSGATLAVTGGNGQASVEDLDGDGLDDLVYTDSVTNPKNPLLYWLQNKGGSFAKAVQIGGGELGDTNDGVRTITQFVGAAPDFAGDGTGDLTIFSSVSSTCTPDYCPPPSTSVYWSFAGGTALNPLGTVWNSQDDLIAPMFVDFNGDGLTDVLYENANSTNSLQWTWEAAVSTGAGLWIDPSSESITWNNILLSNSVTVDYAGNGRQQVLGPLMTGTGDNCPADWAFVGYVQGVFKGSYDLGIASPICKGGSVDGNYVNTSLRAGDVNGDGLGDVVWYEAGSGGGWNVWIHNGPTPDVVSSISNGFGQTYTISYEPLSQDPGYTKGSSAAFPAQDFDGPMSVVTDYSSNDGIGGTIDHTYTYQGAQIDLHGRGFLGFQQVTASDSVDKYVTTTSYSQTFPNIGAVTEVKVLDGSGNLISDTQNSYGQHSTWSTALYTYLSDSKHWDYDTDGSTVYHYTEISTTPIFYAPYQVLQELKTTTTSSHVVPPAAADFTSLADTTYIIYANSNTNTWCLVLPQTVTLTQTGGGGTAQPPRTVTYTRASGTACQKGSESVTEGASGETITTTYGYDPTYGNLDSVQVVGTGGTGGGTRTTTYTYDSTNTFVQTAKNPLGEITTIQWDPSLGVEDSLTDPNNAVTSFVYDPYGVKTTENDPDGTSITWQPTLCPAVTQQSTPPWSDCGVSSLDGAPNKNAMYSVLTTHLSSTNAAGATSTAYYDMFGRALLKSGGLLNNQTAYVQSVYDSLGRVSEQSLPYLSTNAPSGWVVNAYKDPRDRLTSVTRPAGQDADSHCPSVCTTGYAYSGLTTTVIDAHSNSTSRTMDAIGELASTTDANGKTTAYQYDNFGDLTQTTDVAGNVTGMGYDTLGRKTSMTDPNMGNWSYSYTPFGELATQTDAKSQVISMTYDALSRMVTRTKPVGTGTGTDTWTYDGPGGTPTAPYIGRLYSVLGADGYQRIYQYDSIGRPAEVDTTPASSGTTYAMNTSYDTFGRVTSVTYPSTPAPIPDDAPIANAGSNQQITLGQPFTLDGSGSSDPDNGPQPLSFQWTEADGPVSILTSSTSKSLTLTPTVAGVYVFMLTVMDGELTNNATVTVTVQPTAPTGLAASPGTPNGGSYSVSWGNPGGQVSYVVDQSFNSGTFAPLSPTSTFINTTTGTLSRSDGSYQYEVQSCSQPNNAGATSCSAFSAPLSVKVEHTPGAPGVPTFATNPSTNGNDSLSWSPPAGSYVTYYMFYTSTDGVHYDGGTEAGTNAHGLSEMVSPNYYYFTVKACNDVGCGPLSGAGQLKVTGPGRPWGPSLSSNVNVVGQGGSVILSWSSNGGTITSYQLYRYNTNNNTQGVRYSGTATRYTDADLTGPANYFSYYVNACNQYGCTSGNAVEVQLLGSGRPPAAPLAVASPTVMPTDGTGFSAGPDALAPLKLMALDAPALQPIAVPTLGKAAAIHLTQDSLRSKAALALAARASKPRPVAPKFASDRSFDPQAPLLMSYTALEPDAEGNLKVARDTSPVTAVRMAPATVSTTRYSVNYVYDANENLVEVVDAANPDLIYWQATSGDVFDHVTSEILGNNVITSRVYDPNTGTLESEQSGLGSSPGGLENKTYNWDGMGNLTSRVDSIHGTTESFQYNDPLYRLTQATLTGTNVTAGVLNLSYDNVGNIQSKTQPGTGGDVGTYAYDPSHPMQLLYVTSTGGAQRNFQYDNSNGAAGNGNLVSDGINSYNWNADNQPSQISNATTTTAFTYTPDGAREQETTTANGVTTTLTEVNPLFQVTSDGTSTWYQEMISAGGAAIATRTLRQDGLLFTRYMIRDHLGSSSALTDESGNLICETAYDAFGNQRDPNTGGTPSSSTCNSLPQTNGGGEGNGHGYTDQQQLDGLNLIHMNGRVYDPVIGRMVSADPTIPDPTFSQSFNRYAYVYNNPMNATDPSGFDCTGSDEDLGNCDYSDVGETGDNTDNGDDSSNNGTDYTLPSNDAIAACGSDCTDTGSHIPFTDTGASCSGDCATFSMGTTTGGTPVQQGGGIGATTGNASTTGSFIQGDGQGVNTSSGSPSGGGSIPNGAVSGGDTTGATSGGSASNQQTAQLGEIQVIAKRPQALFGIGANLFDFGLGYIQNSNLSNYWLGKNNFKLYAPGHGANGATGARLTAGVIAETVSKGLFIFEAVDKAIDYTTYMSSGQYNQAAFAATDVALGACFIEMGPAGWIVGGVYYGVEDTVGWGPVTQAYGDELKMYPAWAQPTPAFAYPGP